MYIINDEALKLHIINELRDINGYKELEAEEWLQDNIEAILNDMYDVVSDYIFKNTKEL